MEETDSEKTLFVGVVFVGAFSDRRVAPFYYPIDVNTLVVWLYRRTIRLRGYLSR